MADEQRTKVTNNSFGVWNGEIINGRRRRRRKRRMTKGVGERIEKENKVK